MAGWALSCIILVQRPQSYINEIIQVKILMNMINVPQDLEGLCLLMEKHSETQKRSPNLYGWSAT